MNVLYVYADSVNDWNSSEWRCAIPARAINRLGGHAAGLLSILDFKSNSDAARKTCAEADVIVVQRDLSAPTQSAIEHWQRAGKAVIADFDDAFNFLEPSNDINGAYSYWILGRVRRTGADGKPAWVKINPPPLAQFKKGLRMVDAATVSSRLLADDWRDYAPIHYLPNYIEARRYDVTRSAPHDGIILGWGGSATHLASFAESGILAALESVCRDRRDVRVMICGNDPRILQALRIPPAQKIAQPYVSSDEWPRIIANFDIGLAPLHGAYDDRRSWIKVLEYLVVGIPWIASRGPAYDELSAYGTLVKNRAVAWTRAILDVMENIEERRRSAAAESRRFGMAQDIDVNAGRVISIYESVFEKVRAKRPA